MTPTTNARRFLSRALTQGATTPVLITSFVSFVALSALGGCAASTGAQKNNPYNGYNGSGEFTQEQMASRATVQVSPTATSGTFTSDFYMNEGSKTVLPQQWVSEAQEGVAAIEARRAGAVAAQISAQSDESEALAKADFLRQGAISRDMSDRATAETFEKAYAARLNELYTNASAEQQKYEVDSRRNGALLSATVKEWQAEVERLRSQAETEWARSLAENERMNSERKAVGDRGRANIDQMLRAADLTEARAAAKVQNLRTESQSVAQQTQATIDRLNGEVAETQKVTASTVADLRQQATSMKDQYTAENEDLLAQAKALSEIDVEEMHRVRRVAAETDFKKAMADIERLRAETDGLRQSSTADVERQRGEMRRSLDQKRADLNEAVSSIESMVKQGLADIEVDRAKAERLEREARAKFVKAEVEARVRAVHETSAHRVALAEADFARIKAEAEAEAANLQSRLATEISTQLKNGAHTLPENAKQQGSKPSSDQSTPTLSSAKSKNPVVEPARIAQFRGSLAEVAKLRMQADAKQSDLMASSDEQKAGLDSWWAETVASHDAWSAQIAAQERKNQAKINEMVAQIDALGTSAQAEKNRGDVEAESIRKETFAKIASLKAQAESVKKKGEARVTQLVAQADAMERNGKSKIEALVVQRDATLRRGEARSQQLLVEADSLEKSQHAVVAQMRQEIKAAEQILNSELARLDQASDSYIEVAKANYDEGRAMAETFERITIANTSELAAGHLAQRKSAQADVNYMRDMATANDLLAQASVARMLADSDAQLGHFNADDLVRRARIDAQSQIASAAVEAQHTIAGAEEAAVRARFDSRIASTEADRNRAYASLFLKGEQERARAEQAAAAAATYRELSQAAVYRLKQASDQFARAAAENWDGRLALPPNFPVPANTDLLHLEASRVFNFHQWDEPLFNSPTFTTGSSTFNGSVITTVPTPITDND